MSNSETRGSRFSHLRALPGRPFASSRCPVPGQSSQQHRSWHPLASGFDSMQGLTATLSTSQCILFPGLSFGKHVRLCISIPSTCLTDPSTPSGKLQLSQYDPCRPPMRALLMRTWWSAYHEATLLGRRDYDPAIRPIQQSYRLPSHPSARPISTEPPSLGMGTVHRLWITRRVPLYTVTFPSKHLLQFPTESIWPPQINSPTRRTSAL